MRLTHLLLTCCLLISTTLVVAQDETAAVSTVISTIPSSIIGGGIFHDDSSIKINKEIEIEAKDIIVNIGKVDIEIEREKEKRRSDLELATVEDDHHTTHDDDGNKIKINKEIEIEAKDIIVNIGKVKVEIEKDKRDHHTTKKPTHKPTWKPTHKPTHKPTYLPTWKPPHKPHVSEEGEATDSIEGVDEPSDDATDTIEEADEPSDSSAPSESSGPVTPSEPSEPSEPSTPSAPSEPSEPSSSAEDTSSDDDLLGLDELPLFQDFTPAAEPDLSDETILGENATAAAITVQGGEHEDARGVVILTGPQIFSVTFKIVKEKVITITGTGFDFNTANHATNRTQREAVTFIIRGRGFVPGGNLFNQIDGVVGGTSRGGMFEFLEPRVFLGAIPLKVVRFTDTTILARFLDREDQRRFEPGTLLARVKVLHVDIKKEKKKKHGPGEDIGILGEHDEESTEIVSVGGLVLPALGAIGGSITSGPVLGVIGEDAPGNKHDDHGHDDSISTSLLGLFTGLRFDTAVLAVQFSEKDAQKIRGSVSTLLTDDIII